MRQSVQYEQGPIRPPSEAGSLLIRVTRNCPWNQCAFCTTYKGQKFSRRSLEEIKADIDAAKAIANHIAEMSWSNGDGGRLTRRVLAQVVGDPRLNDCYRSVGLWLASGGETVFLQDANSLMLSTDSLVEILDHLRKTFPDLKRVTSYARAATLAKKSVEDLVRLRERGLVRLHVGMESGSDQVLKLINKGCTQEQLIEAGKRVVAAGISLCLYIIPGIGGRGFSTEHATESARVVNTVNPAFVRFRSLYVSRKSTLREMVDKGVFDPPDEDEIVQEIKLFLSSLGDVSTTIVSDHILNLLEEVEGSLPQDRDKMLAVLDRYLNMPKDDRLLFQLGRRAGLLRSLDDLNQFGVRSRLEDAKAQIEKEVPGGVTEYIASIKKQYI
ncbi:MAG: radical SAM protein [Desulfomonile sp.]|nr:radical SAM protein [Desulfomonile sp.]